MRNWWPGGFWVYLERRPSARSAARHDTYPNKWELEYAKDCDLAVHECFAPPSIMVNKQKFGVGEGIRDEHPAAGLGFV